MILSIAYLNTGKGKKAYLYLRKVDSKTFRWFLEDTETFVEAPDPEEAIRLAYREWPDLKLLGCGYFFTLPERDEHGTPALFSQMAKSLESSNGIFFDEERGYNGIVNQIPLETAKIYKDLKAKNLL